MKTELPVMGEDGERAERCETCRWWESDDPHDPTESFGECHRNPPTLSPFEGMRIALNLRDTFLNLERKDGKEYSFDTALGHPYEGMEDEVKTDELGGYFSNYGEFPKTIKTTFCGEWAAIPTKE